MMIALDDGFSFGIGVFETIAVEHGRPLFLEEHMKRMMHAVKKLNISEEDLKETLSRHILEEIKEKQLIRGALKLTVSEKNRVISIRENPYHDEDYKRGFCLRVSPILRNETSIFTYLKTLNYGDNILEKRRAHQEGFDEPVFLNRKGELTEGATTNLFFIKNGRLITPAVSCGLLDGIIRQYILQEFPVEERKIPLAEALDMDEMFVTNSLVGIMPVKSLEDRIFSERSYTERIRERYEWIRRIQNYKEEKNNS